LVETFTFRLEKEHCSNTPTDMSDCFKIEVTEGISVALMMTISEPFRKHLEATNTELPYL
jgi:hypothetical protein